MITTWLFYLSLTLFSVLLFRRMSNTHDYILVLGKRRCFSFNTVAFSLFSVFLFFAVFRTIRETIGGTDAYSYLELFWNSNDDLISYIRGIKITELFSSGEPLFKIFNIIMRVITDNRYIYLAVVYGIIIASLIDFVKFFYYECHYYFSLILVVCAYLYSFNIMRSWISISFCMWAFIALVYNKWVRSLILIIIAGLIHYMAFAFLLVWLICFLYSLKPHFFSKKKLLAIVVISNAACFVARSFIMQFVMTTKYLYYEKLFGTEVSIWGYLPGILICIIAILYYRNDSCFLSMNSIEARKRVYASLALTVNASLVYIIVAMYAWRINDYFMLIRMFAISIIYEQLLLNPKNNKEIVVFVYLFTIACFIQQMLGLKESSGVFPYILSLLERH